MLLILKLTMFREETIKIFSCHSNCTCSRIMYYCFIIYTRLVMEKCILHDAWRHCSYINNYALPCIVSKILIQQWIKLKNIKSTKSYSQKKQKIATIFIINKFNSSIKIITKLFYYSINQI